MCRGVGYRYIGRDTGFCFDGFLGRLALHGFAWLARTAAAAAFV